MIERYYKFLSAAAVGRHSRKKLPIGEWIRVDGPLVLCQNGIHVTTVDHLAEWVDERAHIVDVRGDLIVGDSKVVCREAYIHPALPTWDERAALQFAADCASHVLPLYEAAYPGDDRPRRAIEAARAYARGEIDAAALAAAEDAVRDAWLDARDAVRAAKAAARSAALAATEAAGAAGAAAGAAVGAASASSARAALAAAGGGALAAEQRWQSHRLAQILDGGAPQ